jgi:serine/threonine protein kinase
MSTSSADRDPVETLAAEFMERHRQGENPSIEEYTEKYPELAEEIRDLFPTIAALEGWKLDKAPPPRPLAPAPGTLSYLGDFRIIREIGRGGMGIVYEAEQESLGRHVAVKVLLQGPLLGEKQLRRFQREAKTAARLHHTNIVPVFGVGEQDGLHYYVMQYIRGVGLDAVIGSLIKSRSANRDALDSLRNGAPQLRKDQSLTFTPAQAAQSLRSDRFPNPVTEGSEPEAVSPAPPRAPLTQLVSPPAQTEPYLEVPRTGQPTEELTPLETPCGNGPVPIKRTYWRSVARLGRQVANALDYAHSQNVLHRDIKPANLLLDATGTVWVADFGLAKVLEQDDVTNTGDIVGTLKYMAPEQFQGKYDARSDIYSLGLTLYELLTLQPAFKDTSRARLIRQITQEEPVRPRKINPSIPRDLETIVLKAIARDADRRYQSARDLHNDLQLFLEDRPIHARRISHLVRLGRWCRRNPAVAGLTALALCLLWLVAVVATVGYIHTRDALEGETQQRQRARDALEGETQQRQRAEKTSRLALEVLEEIFQQLAPERVVAVSELTFVSVDGQEVEVTLQPALSPETAALLEKLLAFYDRLAEQGNNDSKVRQQAAKANRRVGDIRLHLGQTEQAVEAYQRAAFLSRELARQHPEEVKLQVELAGVYNAMGQAYLKIMQPAKAKEGHLTAIQILTSPSLAGAPPVKINYELARTYYHLSKIPPEFRPPPGPKNPGGPGPMPGGKPPGPKNQGGPPPWPGGNPEARKYLDKAIELLKDLVKEHPAIPAYRHLLGLCYREKSTSLWERARPIDWKDRKEAKNQWEQLAKQFWEDRKEAKNLLEQLVKQFPNVPEYRHDLSDTLALMDMRGPFSPFATSPNLEKDYQEALQLSRELVTEHPNVPDYQVSKAQIHFRLGFLHRVNKQLDTAEKDLRQALTLQNALVQRFPKVLFHQFAKSIFQDTLIDVLMDQKKWTESRSLLESSIQRLEMLIGKDEKMRSLTFPLANYYFKLARALRGLEMPELAAQAEQRARELRATFKGPGGPSGKPGEKKPPKGNR